MSGGVPTRFSMANTLPKLKKSSSWRISSERKKFFCIHVHSHGIARSKCYSYGEITKRMNFNCPVAETSESIEPNDNNLELNAIAYIFSKIDSNLNFNTEYARSFGDRELLAFSSEANGETEKKNYTFSAVEDSTLLRWHSGTQKRVGRTKQRDQIDNEARLFW